MSGARLHGIDALAAVAQATVLIHSLIVLIYWQNESENGRLRERERIIMFPLLSRLPQLSLKRGSQSTCLLIHLKLTNNRTPPHVSLSISPLTLVLPPTVSSLFHIKLLFIALLPPIWVFFFFPHSTSVSAPISALSLCMCFASSLASPLSSTWV